MSPINRPECQQWMIKVYAKCRDLLGPNDYDTPALYKDMNWMTPEDCNKLKRTLDRKWNIPEIACQNKVVTAILAVAAIVVLGILFVCGVKWRSRTKTDSSGQQEGLPETPQDNRKKKFNFKKWVHRSFRFCFVQTKQQGRRHQTKARNQVDVHKKLSQQKLAKWTKARKQNAQRKKEKLERRRAKEHDLIEKSIPPNG